jgi:hypothetical protein
MIATVLLCPDCGAALSRDVSARVAVEHVSIRPLRSEAPHRVWTPCVLDSCTRCEWTRVVSRGGAL